LAHIFQHVFGCAIQRISQAAAAGTLDAQKVPFAEPLIAEARWQALFLMRARIDNA
jgi:hypothetical protein